MAAVSPPSHASRLLSVAPSNRGTGESVPEGLRRGLEGEAWSRGSAPPRVSVKRDGGRLESALLLREGAGPSLTPAYVRGELKGTHDRVPEKKKRGRRRWERGPPLPRRAKSGEERWSAEGQRGGADVVSCSRGVFGGPSHPPLHRSLQGLSPETVRMSSRCHWAGVFFGVFFGDWPRPLRFLTNRTTVLRREVENSKTEEQNVIFFNPHS